MLLYIIFNAYVGFEVSFNIIIYHRDIFRKLFFTRANINDVMSNLEWPCVIILYATTRQYILLL